MTPQAVLEIFQNNNALLKGHFLLSSGLHSERYLQCALVLQHPKLAKKLGQSLAEKFKISSIDTVISPALGGLIIGYEVAKALGVRFIFTERQDGQMTLRRGFSITPGEKLIVIEDVFTTGGSTKEVMATVEQAGAKVVGVGAIINRSEKEISFGVPSQYLLPLQVKTFEPAQCPLCKEGLPFFKPGSRNKAT
ncbi:MAG: orotate phosphoribosyltransferase [bacterium]|nr:orotate phosphoribosyltransferase [bacterium]MDD5353751.1 orotate phosphoribosyltransferase [bacterium]MDD5755781.1 orotate phosphoribosyltransferase [bacterium]